MRKSAGQRKAGTAKNSRQLGDRATLSLRWSEMPSRQYEREIEKLSKLLDAAAQESRAQKGALDRARRTRKAAHQISPNWDSEIGVRCQMVYSFELTRPSDDSVEARTAQVKRIHRDLTQLNYKIVNVDRLREIHRDALLTYWQKTLSRRSAATLWTALAWWAEHALGKPGLIPSLASVWPEDLDPTGQGALDLDAAQAPVMDFEDMDLHGEQAHTQAMPWENATIDEAEAANVDAQAAKGKAPRVTTPSAPGTESVEDGPEVIEQLRALDERAWWITRLVAVYGLTIKEAIGFMPQVGLFLAARKLVVTERKGRQGDALAIDTPEKKALAEELYAVSKAWGRSTVGWPQMDTRQARNRFNYLQRRARQVAAQREPA